MEQASERARRGQGRGAGCGVSGLRIRLGRVACLLAMGLLVETTVHWFSGPVRVAAAPRADAIVPKSVMPAASPDAVCASCHQAIYQRYEQTPMARGSGRAVGGLIEGGFTHRASGVTYRVYGDDTGAKLSFDRDGAAGPLHGVKDLEYYVGSNHRGRTYLYREGQQWFEAPINFYSKRALWDMSPNYGDTRTMPAALPVDANCLHCHATAVSATLPQARNAFAGEPFAQGGVGCSACHGDAREHVATGGRGPVVNPDKLPVARRDSACVQCHLEGDATVYRAGKSLAEFKAGDDLADYAVYFVRASREAGGGRASSQYEALLRSACKRGAGDRLTCTTCHDPHGSPAPAERVAWFRAKCVACHAGPEIAVTHHPEQQDCAVCHMPTRNATDISHEQATDHNVERRPPAGILRFASLGAAEELLPVGGVKATDREFGLAYAQRAVSGDRASGERAMRLLRAAEAAGAGDAYVHAQLGYLDQRAGDVVSAVREYRAALAVDPYEASALGNLAVLEASRGQVAEAMRLLQRVVDADPAKTPAGMNLAFLECRTGEKGKAAALLARLSTINPDDPALRAFMITGVYGGQKCVVGDAAR